MNKNIKNIQDLIHDKILGLITPEDEVLLQEWIDESADNRRLYDTVIGKSNLAERYSEYSKIDENAAWKKFQDRYFNVSSSADTLMDTLTFERIRRRISAFTSPTTIAAAAMVLLIAGFATIWFNKNEHESLAKKEIIERVELSEASEKAQAVASQSGRQIASVTIGDKVIEISSPEEYAEILENAPVDERMEIATNQKHEYWITLPDGTRVHLNNNTRLKYPTHFSGSQREVILSGMATFKVAKGNGPFIVSTSDGIITDLGTEFFINTNADNGGTEVVLFSGKVKVDNRNGMERMLAPGEKAEFSLSSQIRTSQADITFYRATSEGVFLFRNTTMEKMMDLIGHWYGVKVEFSRPELAETTFTGSLDKYSSLRSILDAIEAVTGYDISNDGEKVFIRG